jgi:hypothetical protein
VGEPTFTCVQACMLTAGERWTLLSKVFIEFGWIITDRKSHDQRSMRLDSDDWQ